MAALIKGKQIGASTIAGANIVNDGANGVAAANINNGAITTTQISSTAGITGSQIAALAITAANINNGTITTTQISGTAGITGGQIAVGTITGGAGGNISATAGITGSQIASTTIAASNIANNVITTTQISLTAGITGGQIATGTIGASNIANHVITATQIAAGTITTTEISGSAGITGGQIASATITGANLASSTITSSQVDATTVATLAGTQTFTGSKAFTGTTTFGTGGSVSLTETMSLSGVGKITGIDTSTITSPADAANKAYVDATAQGLAVHASVRAATTAALPAYDVAVSAEMLVATPANFVVSDVITNANGDKGVITAIDLTSNEFLFAPQTTALAGGDSLSTSAGTVVVTSTAGFNPSGGTIYVPVTAPYGSPGQYIIPVAYTNVATGPVRFTGCTIASGTATTAAGSVLNGNWQSGMAAGSGTITNTGSGSSAYSNSVYGPGTTLTGQINGAIGAIDTSVTLSPGDRLLVHSESGIGTVYQGVYVVTAVGSGAAKYVLTRADDFDETAGSHPDFTDGSFFFITEGNTYATTGWVYTGVVAASAVVDVTVISFSQFSGAGSVTAGNGLDQTGSTLFVKPFGGNATSTPGSNSGLKATSSGLQVVADTASNTVTTIAVGAGGVSVLYTSTGGITATSTSGLQIKLDTNPGLQTLSGGLSILLATNSGLTLTSGLAINFAATNPSRLGAAADPGTGVTAARIDHVHLGDTPYHDYFYAGASSAGAGLGAHVNAGTPSTYNLSAAPLGRGKVNNGSSAPLVQFFLNGQMLEQGADYTVSGSAVTYGVGGNSQDLLLTDKFEAVYLA